MRIALITSQAFSLFNFRGPLISTMVGRGVEVIAIAPDYDEQSRAAVRSLGASPVDCSFSRAGMNPLRDGLDTVLLASLLRRCKVDMVLTYFAKPVIFGTFAALLARVPQRFCMIEGLGYAFIPSPSGETFKRRLLRGLVSHLYKWALRYAQKVFLLNNDDIAELMQDGVVNSRQVVKLGGIGVDLMDWLPAPPVKQPITFLLAARLLREKGVTDYAEAAKLVKSAYPDTRFILLGALDVNPGSLGRAEVTSWVTQGLLEWPGHVQVRPWLAQASVFVLPSYREGVPRSTQEAMAMGRAVITTRVPGCRETVDDGRNGFLVPACDPAALAQAMLRFIHQPELIERMGKVSREIAVERFDVHKVNALMLSTMGILEA